MEGRFHDFWPDAIPVCHGYWRFLYLENTSPCFLSFPHVIIYLTRDHRLYLVDTLIAIHLPQLVLLFVVVEHLAGCIEEDDQPFSHCFSCIIRTLIEHTAVQITHTRHFRWVKLDIVDV